MRFTTGEIQYPATAPYSAYRCLPIKKNQRTKCTQIHAEEFAKEGSCVEVYQGRDVGRSVYKLYIIFIYRTPLKTSDDMKLLTVFWRIDRECFRSDV